MNLKKRITAVLFCIFCLPNIVYSQDDFVLGMFHAQIFDDPTDTLWPATGGVPTMAVYDGHNTSQLNVLAEDGFNVFSRYTPDIYTSVAEQRALLLLTQANGMQMLTNAKDWYKS